MRRGSLNSARDMDVHMDGSRRPLRAAPAWYGLVASLWCLYCNAAEGDARRHFELQGGDAVAMLNEFGRQAGLQVLFDFNVLKGIETRPVTGDLAIREALRTMLVGTKLVYAFVNERTLSVTLAAPKPSAWRRMLGLLGTGRPPPAAPQSPAVLREGLEQVLISGLAGSEAQALTGAPTIEFNRADIDHSGLATTQDFLQTLPQVFGGGPNEDTVLGREASSNSARGAGVNLRGLDAGATLVLIDGRRLAPSGTEGSFTDISNIPLSLVDHIEVLPDGTSARYGADAVGGVVNFVMRSDFAGAQTQARAGTVTDGSLAEHQLSQLLGTHWDGGNLLFAFDYYQRDALRARDRAQETSNLTAFGGYNFDAPYGTPGTLTNGVSFWPLPPSSVGAPVKASSLVPGPPNLYDLDRGTDVTPSEERWSLYGKLRLQPSDALELFADGLFTSRRVNNVSSAANPLIVSVPSTNPFYINPAGGTAPITVYDGSTTYFGQPEAHIHVNTGNFAVGASLFAANGWTTTGYLGFTFEDQLETDYGLYDQAALDAALADTNPATAFNPFEDGAHNNPATLASIARTGLFSLNSTLRTVSLTTGGPAFWLPAGPAQLTAGGEYRDQIFDTLTLVGTQAPGYEPRADLGRRVSAGFGELVLPIFGAAGSESGGRQAELSLGVRHEEYSDVGGITVPKLGIRWSPASGLNLRGTFTRSFNPPALPDLDVRNSFSTLLSLPDSSAPSGFSTTLVRYGSNPALQPERARSWTAGADLAPPIVPGLALALTYFNIRFAARIDDPQITANVLQDPAFAWLVTRNVSQAQIQSACTQGTFVGTLASCFDTPIAAIVDERLANIALLSTTGIDVLAKYTVPGVVGSLQLGLNGTYLLKYASADTPAAPLMSLLDTQNNPLDLRLRGSLTWSHRGFGLATYLNYQNGYHDTLSMPNRRVDSLTTVDLQLSYEMAAAPWAPLGPIRVALNVRNLFDTYPPFLNNPLGVGYDQENADLLGRFVSLDTRVRW